MITVTCIVLVFVVKIENHLCCANRSLTFLIRLGTNTNGASHIFSPPLSFEKLNGTISQAKLSPTSAEARALCFLSLANVMLKVFSHLHVQMCTCVLCYNDAYVYLLRVLNLVHGMASVVFMASACSGGISRGTASFSSLCLCSFVSMLTSS